MKQLKGTLFISGQFSYTSSYRGNRLAGLTLTDPLILEGCRQLVARHEDDRIIIL